MKKKHNITPEKVQLKKAKFFDQDTGKNFEKQMTKGNKWNNIKSVYVRPR